MSGNALSSNTPPATVPAPVEPPPVFKLPPLFNAPPPVDEGAAYRFHAHKIRDPFRPLENLDDEKVRPWLNLQRLKLKRYVEPALAERIAAEVLAAADTPRGELPDYFWNDDLQGGWVSHDGQRRQGEHLYFLSRHDEYDTLAREDASGEIEVLFLSNEIPDMPGCRIEGVWIDQIERHALCKFIDDDKRQREGLIRLRGGVLLETFAPIEFLAWETAGFGLYYTKNEEPSNTSRKTLYYHRIGLDWEGDLALVAPTAPAPDTFYIYLILVSGNRIHVRTVHDDRYGQTWRDYLVERDNPGRLVSLPPVTELLPHGLDILGLDATDIFAVVQKAKGNDVIRLPLKARHWSEATTLLRDLEFKGDGKAWFRRGKIGLILNEDLRNVLLIADRDGRTLHRFVPATPSWLAFEVSEGNELRLCSGNYTMPLARHTVSLDDFSVTSVERPHPAWMDDIVISREMVPASDGTLVPMTILRHARTPLDGTAPALLYAYGGFGHCLTPEFNANWAYWLGRRGILAIAHIRGDGGWTPGWSAAGTGANRLRSLDDVCDCAAWLVEKGYTQVATLVAAGASNGGMTVAAAMLRRPELFGAVVSIIPVMDMLNLFLSNGDFDRNAWMGEYGDPNKLDEFRTLMSFSPLHNVRRDVAYPKILVMAGEADVRAYPGHATKFVATMQDIAGPDSAYLYLKSGAGHDDFFSHETASAMDASGTMFAFIEKATGIDARRRIIHALAARCLCLTGSEAAD